jgi:PIN domain nuclease of toxin-antitoxin system
MRLLLDTHAMLWYVDQEHLLRRASLAAITDPANELLISAASIWELAIKIGNGKLTLSSPYRQWTTRALSDLRASLLPITVEYADVQATLPKHHGDPFDRLLIAQAIVEKLAIVSGDSVFDRYGVARIW